jgi:heme/copper-type cytochrome/quinol oxidase subunit 2
MSPIHPDERSAAFWSAVAIVAMCLVFIGVVAGALLVANAGYRADTRQVNPQPSGRIKEF